MDTPMMLRSHSVNADTVVLPSVLPVPGYGTIAINAFLIRAAEPVLIDTGMSAVRDEFMAELEQRIDLDDLRWLWLTHTDPDHIGSAARILNEAPHLKVVTTYVGMAKMSLQDLPVDRVHLLNPGQALDVGDRTLTALRPPTFDAPETTCLFDSNTRTLFSADSFGALLDWVPESANEIPASDLRAGMELWTSIDSPWLEVADPGLFAEKVSAYRRIRPEFILSSHLPPAESSLFETLLTVLTDACGKQPFVGPDQEMLEAMMSQRVPPRPPTPSGEAPELRRH